MIVYDAAGVKTAISPDGSGSVYDAAGRRVSASSIIGNLYNFDNAPTAPSAYDDEFNGGALDAKWTIGSAGTTNPAVAGTIDYTASLTTPIIDLGTQPGWLLFQSDNSSVKELWVDQALSPAANATFFVKIGCANRNVSTNGEGQIAVRLWNSADSNEAVAFGTGHTGDGRYPFLVIINNGAVTTVLGNGIAETIPTSHMYAVCWKKGDVYHFGATLSTGAFDYIGSATKTGVTTFDRLRVEMTTGNETPSIVDGVDFFRYYPSVVYGLSNPAV